MNSDEKLDPQIFPNDSDLEQNFGALVERYQSRLVSFLYPFVFDRETALDLAQEVFVKAYLRLASYDRKRPFSSWLFGIAANHARDFIRRKRLPTMPLSAFDAVREFAASEDYLPSRALEMSELADSMSHALAALALDDRELILLRHIAEMSIEDIAEKMRMTPANTKTRLFRARKRMQKLLEYNPSMK